MLATGKQKNTVVDWLLEEAQPLATTHKHVRPACASSGRPCLGSPSPWWFGLVTCIFSMFKGRWFNPPNHTSKSPKGHSLPGKGNTNKPHGNDAKNIAVRGCVSSCFSPSLPSHKPLHRTWANVLFVRMSEVAIFGHGFPYKGVTGQGIETS